MPEFLQLLFTSKFKSILITSRFFSNTFHSYEAAEDNEISFNEGDKITEIEPASEDWWQGTNPHGNVGLFPGKSSLFFYVFFCWNETDAYGFFLKKIANYVEVVEAEA